MERTWKMRSQRHASVSCESLTSGILFWPKINRKRILYGQSMWNETGHPNFLSIIRHLLLVEGNEHRSLFWKLCIWQICIWSGCEQTWMYSLIYKDPWWLPVGQPFFFLCCFPWLHAACIFPSNPQLELGLHTVVLSYASHSPTVLSYVTGQMWSMISIPHGSVILCPQNQWLYSF